jgi:hypothetical protein
VKKKLTMLAAFCALTIFAVPAVSAAPAAAVNVQPGAKVILVAGGCGVGWHRGPYGGCRRNLPALALLVAARSLWPLAPDLPLSADRPFHRRSAP